MFAKARVVGRGSVGPWMGAWSRRVIAGFALGAALAAASAGTAVAQSGLEQAKSVATEYVDPFAPEDVPDLLAPYEVEAEEEMPVLVGEELEHPVKIHSYVVGMPGENGWYRSDVVLFWAVGGWYDAGPEGCGPQVILQDQGARFTCGAGGGMHGWKYATVEIKRDTQPPQVAVTGVEHGTTYTEGSVPTPACETTEEADVAAGRSGVQAPATLTVFGGSGVGHFTAVCDLAKDNAGNAQLGPVSATYTVVPAPPQITPQIVGTVGGGGWYTSGVTLTWEVTGRDVTKTGCADRTITADQAATTYSCTATNSVGEDTESVSIKRDTTAPDVAVTGVVNGANYAEGSVPAAGCETEQEGEGESGTAEDATLTTSGGPLGWVTATCAGATDTAGNAGFASVMYKVLAVPKVTPHVDGTLGGDGWYTSDVTVTWQLAGSELETDGCGPVTIDVDQVAQTYTCTAKNAVGQDSRTVSISRDTRAPDVAVTGVADGATYIEGGVPVAGCATEEEGTGESGTVQHATLTSSGGPFGTITATCGGAEDAAGNSGSATATYQVHYPFAGFYAPIDINTLNVVQAGRAVPVKFSLSGDRGLDILAAGSPSSHEITCDGSLPVDAVEDSAPLDAAKLTYDAATDRYVYVWKTSDAWAGTCRKLRVSLTDGSHHTAVFQLR